MLILMKVFDKRIRDDERGKEKKGEKRNLPRDLNSQYQIANSSSAAAYRSPRDKYIMHHSARRPP